MDRRYELDRKLKSLAMLAPHHPQTLNREDALALVTELAAMEERLRRPRDALQAVLDDLDRGR